MNREWKELPPETVEEEPPAKMESKGIPGTPKPPTMQGNNCSAPALNSKEMDLLEFPDSDAGNAERFHALFGSNLRHVRESGKWLVWNGYRWEGDEDGEPTRLFISAMREMASQAVTMQNPQAAQAKASFALRSTNREKVTSGLELSKSISGVTVNVDRLDRDPWKVGTTAGVVDLRKGESIKPERDQLITKQIGTHHDPDADYPLWREFIDTVTGGDSDLASYLQAAVGYSLTGLCREQCLFFLHGTGQNGKGVFSETLKRLFGDYAQTAPETLFTKDRNSSATNDIARLVGVRFAIAAELEENSSFAESRLKGLTGGDSITARFLHKEFFDFEPTHKFWISGNHKPTVRGTDTGIWRRLRLVPFTTRIPEDKKDPELAEKLIHELPGILNWAIEGCRQWQDKGLVTPQCVRKATEGYRREEDVIGQFLDDCTDSSDNASRTHTTLLFNEYIGWAEQEGIQPKYRLSARRLIRRIEDHGFVRGKYSGNPSWIGLRIKND